MEIRAGKILVSTDAMEDINFEKSIVVIANNDEKGTLGFVINKPFGRNLNELEEFKQSPPFPLYAGGPVDTEHLFFIHRRPSLVQGGTLITGDLFLSGDFARAVAEINKGNLSSAEIKIFVGYCGWDDNELENEILEGSWTLQDADIDKLFTER